VALDVQAQNGFRGLLRLLRGLGELDAAGLAASADLHLRLDDDLAADALGGGPGFFRSVRDGTRWNRYAMGGEEFPRLVLVEVHGTYCRLYAVWKEGFADGAGDHSP
jgi:hypothetical protein